MNNDLIVLVKKYFDKANGNTYHSVQFDFNDKIYHSGKIYGYERQYEETFKHLTTFLCAKPRRKAEHEKFLKLIDKNIKYIVIDNCKAKELKQIHEYK